MTTDYLTAMHAGFASGAWSVQNRANIHATVGSVVSSRTPTPTPTLAS